MLSVRNGTLEKRSRGGDKGAVASTDEEIGVRETFKSTIKSIHWKVALK